MDRRQRETGCSCCLGPLHTGCFFPSPFSPVPTIWASVCFEMEPKSPPRRRVLLSASVHGAQDAHMKPSHRLREGTVRVTLFPVVLFGGLKAGVSCGLSILEPWVEAARWLSFRSSKGSPGGNSALTGPKGRSGLHLLPQEARLCSRGQTWLSLPFLRCSNPVTRLGSESVCPFQMHLLES